MDEPAADGSRRVLIVDDDDDIREVAQAALRWVGGWQVDAARSGQEALALAAEIHPEVILLDVMMPDMDGPTTLGRLRDEAETTGIPVILLTAKTPSRQEADWAALGVVGMIAKPFDPMALPGQVARLLGWSA